MNRHAHDLKFLAEPTHISPPPDVFKTKHATAAPGARIQAPFILREGIGLRVVADLTAVRPGFAVKAMHMPAVVAAGVDEAVMHGQRFDTLRSDLLGLEIRALWHGQCRPARFALVAEESGGLEQ